MSSSTNSETMRLHTSLDFEQVREQISADDSGKWDAVVARGDVFLQDGRVNFADAYRGGYGEGLLPNAWAMTQMCQRLSIPTAYFKRCPTSLQDAQFNYWAKQHRNGHSVNGHSAGGTIRDEMPHYEGVETFDANGAYSDTAATLVKSEPEQYRGTSAASESSRSSADSERSEPQYWLLRAKGDTLRGVLSDRYAVMDNASLLKCLEPLLNERFQVGWFAMSDESMHLRLVDPTLSRDVFPDDRLMVGIHVANSEVGKRSVTVDAMVFRLVCSNGLIRLVKGKSLLHQRHIYLSQYRFISALRQAMGQALTTAAGFIEQLMWATRAPVKDVEKTLKTVAERSNLSQSFQELVKLALLNERPDQQETIYGLTNAFTNAAQSLPGDERYDVEVLAGRLIEHGVRHNGYAPSKYPVGEKGAIAVPTRSITQMAQEMFEAEVVNEVVEL